MTPQSRLLNAELKHLYTVITRAKANLWIYAMKEHYLPTLKEWRENSVPLIHVVDLNDPNENFEASFATAKCSTSKEWKKQGDLLKREKQWKQASLCYKLAHRFDLVAETEVVALQDEPLPQYQDIAIALLKLDEIAHNAHHLVEVAGNLCCAAKQPEDFLNVAWLYKALKMVRNSIEELHYVTFE